jgi:hypothetical protein
VNNRVSPPNQTGAQHMNILDCGSDSDLESENEESEEDQPQIRISLCANYDDETINIRQNLTTAMLTK